MELHIEDNVADWYKEELELTCPAQLRFYVRYGGFGGHIPGFSLGIRKEEPNDVFASAVRKDLTFFVEAKDAWYFEDKDLYVSWNMHYNEPKLVCK